MVEGWQAVIDHWHHLASGPLHGVNPLKMALSLSRIGKGTFQALRLLRQTKPKAIFLTGGWVGVPVAIAGRLMGIPIVIYVPDIEPGHTLKFLGRFAQVITCTAQETERYYPYHRHVIETGYPLRETLLQATRADGLAHFGLDADKRTVLVFGGSRGSRAINTVILEQVHDLMTIPDLQILHISGRLDAEAVREQHARLPESIKTRYILRDYVEDFGLALAVADLVICRAGASTMGEFPIFQTPSILIPLAYSWRYQEVNADWLVARQAAIRLDEPEMAQKLVPLVKSLFGDPTRLEALKQGLAKIARTDGAENIAKQLLSFVD